MIYVVSQRDHSPGVALMCDSTASGVLMQLVGKRDALMPPKPEESLGTGHGARESSYASYTTFERASSSPDEVDSVWYDSYKNLVARGVIPTPPRPIAVEPQPFPNGGFAPDPAG